MFEDVPAINALQFFSVELDCLYVSKAKEVFHKDYLIPTTAQLLDEQEFAKVYLGWNEYFIQMYFEVFVDFEEVSYSEYRKGDSVELFFDTRDLKDQSFMTQFCHHFIVYPQKIKNIHAREITRFRSDETHILCDPENLMVEASYAKNSYTLNIKIPTYCLYGFDCKNFRRMGFCYRINQSNNPPQHFGLSSFEYKIEQNPSLWPSLILID